MVYPLEVIFTGRRHKHYSICNKTITGFCISEYEFLIYLPGSIHFIFPEPAWYKYFIIPNETKNTWQLMIFVVDQIIFLLFQSWPYQYYVQSLL